VTMETPNVRVGEWYKFDGVDGSRFIRRVVSVYQRDNGSWFVDFTEVDETNPLGGIGSRSRPVEEFCGGNSACR